MTFSLLNAILNFLLPKPTNDPGSYPISQSACKCIHGAHLRMSMINWTVNLAFGMISFILHLLRIRPGSHGPFAVRLTCARN
ncbi:hypothetical protein CY34DRAFT_806551 [Suillus luteus UH-Slu-Lm8-n1]|uniref:Uncharacterized protein n=1 Tax=Suillus luteus UH-Slu-Lm8-n1 TaxID=930992 RepID=A0A0D0AGW9_9AGAM|nr:hypothetical protein CY34DRAFT_806551 [Suillus luteus UH-Slu-Lm8-n1]